MRQIICRIIPSTICGTLAISGRFFPRRIQYSRLHQRHVASIAPSNHQKQSAVQLRPYQKESIQSVLKYLEDGEKRLGVSLATGGGKTVIFSHLIDRVPAPSPGATRTLILAHRRELVEQAARHCRALYPDKHVDVEMGNQRATGLADITVASVQSIISGDRLMRYDPDRFKLLLVDEAHHIVAPSYLEILRHFKLAEKEKGQQGQTALVGVSATFSRSDGLRLGAAVDHIVYHKDYVDMIEDKWLADVRFTTVQSGADLSRVKTLNGGDFQTASLSKAVNTLESNDITVRSWLSIAENRKSTLVFCVDLAHVAALTAAFRAHGMDARFVTGDTQMRVRAERLSMFKAGEYPVLLNCGIFTEGTDIPNIDCIILARPTKSRNLLIQMVGRGLRNSPGKGDCHVIDMVASLEKGIVTTPTLFGLDPHELVKDADPEALADLRSRKEKEQVREDSAQHSAGVPDPSLTNNHKGNITFTHYDDVNSLIENTSGEHHIRGLSSFSWVQVDHNRYILSSSTGSYLSIKIEGRQFLVTHTQRIPSQPDATPAKSKAPYMRPVTIATTSTFEDAVHAADTFAKKKFVVPMLLTSSRWRRYPATQEQVAFLNKFREEGKKLELGSVTKGRAADWITKIKFGARGRVKKMQTEKAKVVREQQKNEKLAERQRKEIVKVGPVVD